jgi:hypothetical protein
MTYHIAQVNIGRILAPLTEPQMADFVNNLEPINALADAAPGFVWRLQTEEGNATSITVFDDPMLLINMSVWESVDALYNFVYSSKHVEFIRRRREWFEMLGTPIMTLWWIPAGHLPTTSEAKERLELLQQRGTTPLAFTFKQRFTVDEMLKAQRA